MTWYIILSVVVIIIIIVFVSLWYFMEKDSFTTPPPQSPPDHLTVEFNPGPIHYDDDNEDTEIFLIVKIYCDVQYKYLSNARFTAVDSNNDRYEFMNYYDALKPGDYSGQIFGQDNDQYAHYFFCFPIHKIQVNRVHGYPLNNVNYWSFIVGDRKNLKLYKTINGSSTDCKYSFNGSTVPNPFISKTTNCYAITNPDNSPTRYFRFANFITISDIFSNRWNDEKKILPGFFEKDTGKIGVFRVDKETCLQSFISEDVKTTCFDNYLFSSVQYRENDRLLLNFSYQDFIPYGVMRIPTKMNGYVSTDRCNDVWRYDLAYFSVTFHVSDKLLNPPLLPFWTINLRMLKQIADADGFAYIFWAPYDDVVSMMEPSSSEAPIIEWGDRKGYLLQTPTGRIIYRYKAVSPKWRGYPGNAPCYDTYLHNRPIHNELVDRDTGIDYCPSVYGHVFDSYRHFLESDNIGSVIKNGPWPV